MSKFEYYVGLVVFGGKGYACCVHEVQRIRLDLCEEFRADYSRQSRLDGCSGRSSMSLAIEIRMAWAKGSWLQWLEAAAAYFHGRRAWLLEVGILYGNGEQVDHYHHQYYHDRYKYCSHYH